MSSCQNDRPPTHTCHGVSYKHLAYQRQSSKNSDLCLYSDGKSPHMHEPAQGLLDTEPGTEAAGVSVPPPRSPGRPQTSIT